MLLFHRLALGQSREQTSRVFITLQDGEEVCGAARKFVTLQKKKRFVFFNLWHNYLQYTQPSEQRRSVYVTRKLRKFEALVARDNCWHPCQKAAALSK